MKLKDEHLALTSGIGLAGTAVSHFSDVGRDAMETFREEIIDCIVRPKRTTAVHYYLGYLQDISKEVELLRDADYDNEYVFEFIERTLKGVDLLADLPIPDFDNCPGDSYGSHYEGCKCDLQLQLWKDYLDEKSGMVDELIVHSAFQVIYLDRIFLHDFHLELADFIEDYIEEIKEKHHDCVTIRNRINRRSFPEWLKDAVYYRDKGTCSNPDCRCDLSKRVRRITVRNFDHIIPLNLFGSNDASNIQLLCEDCNNDKRDYSTLTGAVNTPFWNLE